MDEPCHVPLTCRLAGGDSGEFAEIIAGGEGVAFAPDQDHAHGCVVLSAFDGVGKSAGVVTSAAIIMVAVFSIFATLSMIDVKMLGVGLAAAVLIDATLVRGVVLPAALALLGEWAWYLPRWLSWLPGRSLACEAAPDPAPAHSAGPCLPAVPVV